jgi:NitT/TauT family transport system substrate-binding protein
LEKNALAQKQRVEAMKKFVAAICLAVGLGQAAYATDVLKFGSTRVPAPLNVGMEKGFFAEQGIRIEQVFFKSGAEVAPSVASGVVDAAATTSGAALFNAIHKGINVKLVADGLSLTPGAPGGDPTSIIVRKDLMDSGEITSAANLSGHRIATTAPGQILDIVAHEFLRRGGVDAKSVTFVSMAPPDMVAAMQGGAIDAAVMLDPFSTIVIQRGIGARLAAGSEIMPGLQQVFIVYGPKLTKGNRDLGERFMRAYARTTEWMLRALASKEGRADIAAIYQKIVPVKDPALYEQIALSVPAQDLRVNLDGEFGVKWQVQQLADRGLLLGMPDVSASVDNSFVDTIGKK